MATQGREWATHDSLLALFRILGIPEPLKPVAACSLELIFATRMAPEVGEGKGRPEHAPYSEPSSRIMGTTDSTKGAGLT